MRLTEIHRTSDPGAQEAWRALRRGEPEKALAYYRQRGELHITDTRDQAVEHAARLYDELSQVLGHDRVALMTDASTTEVNRLNARVQQLRLDCGELGQDIVEIGADGVHYQLRAGDRITWTKSQQVEDGPRVENGTRGTIHNLDSKTGRIDIKVDVTGRSIHVEGEQLASIRLAYAQHLYRQQGATVDRSITVTGGWQTSREGAYVQATRARLGTDWLVSREDLASDGIDTDRIEQLANTMRETRAQAASISQPAVQPEPRTPDIDLDTGLGSDLDALGSSLTPDLDPNDTLFDL